MKNYVSIDVGGTSIKYGIINENGEIFKFDELDTNSHLGGQHILEQLISIVSSYKEDYKILGICISTAGIVDCEKGVIAHASELIPNYTGTPIKEKLEKIFNIPCEVENDVNCAGLSEAYVGSSKNSNISLCLTVGTGIGGCIIIDKKVFHGASNSACEVGYMNMLGSSFEKLGAGSILVKNVAKSKGVDVSTINGKIIFELAKDGDEICIKCIDDMCDILGYGIANICYIINPQTVVLGGGIMSQKDFLQDKIQRSLKKYLIPPMLEKTKITFAKNGNKAGMLGAYYNWISKN